MKIQNNCLLLPPCIAFVQKARRDYCLILHIFLQNALFNDNCCCWVYINIIKNYVYKSRDVNFNQSFIFIRKYKKHEYLHA